MLVARSISANHCPASFGQVDPDISSLRNEIFHEILMLEANSLPPFFQFLFFSESPLMGRPWSKNGCMCWMLNSHRSVFDIIFRWCRAKVRQHPWWITPENLRVDPTGAWILSWAKSYFDWLAKYFSRVCRKLKLYQFPIHDSNIASWDPSSFASNFA